MWVLSSAGGADSAAAIRANYAIKHQHCGGGKHRVADQCDSRLTTNAKKWTPFVEQLGSEIKVWSVAL